MADIKAEDVDTLLKTWSLLTDSARWVLLLALVVIIVLFIINKVLAYKSNATIENNKQKRAQLYNQTLMSLNTSINSFINDQKTFVERLVTTYESSEELNKNINQNINTIRSSMSKILSNQEGILDRRFSMKIIEHYFNIYIFTSVAEIIEKSLRENDFANRQEFIANKIRTKIGTVMDGAQRELKDFNFSIDVDTFFEIDKDATGKRYVLIDFIWNSVKPFYLKEDIFIDQKCEECKLLISFIIKDYFNNKATQYLSDSGSFVART